MKLLNALILAGTVLMTSCLSREQEQSSFMHDLDPGPQPWSHQNFDQGKDQFTFAIISDLNGGERPGVFDVAVEQINMLRPEFIMSVGDLIDGGTEDRVQLGLEWDRFDSRAQKARAPFFYVGGNHDLTNVTMREVWAERLGSRYYHFTYKNVLFLVLDSEDFTPERMQEVYVARAEAIQVLEGDNPEQANDMEYFHMEERRTGQLREEQIQYFEKVLAEHLDVRWTFLFMHKPVWKANGGFTRLESALGQRGYTVFNGHEHNYSYTERNGRDYIMLGTTGGGQDASLETSFDHIILVSLIGNQPEIANLRLDGVLNKKARIPGNGELLCFQASKCGEAFD